MLSEFADFKVFPINLEVYYMPALLAGNHTEVAILKTFNTFLHQNPFLVKVYLVVAKATWAQTACYHLICTHLVELTLLEQALYRLHSDQERSYDNIRGLRRKEKGKP